MVKRMNRFGVPMAAVLFGLALTAAGCGDDATEKGPPVEQVGDTLAILRRLPPETSGGIRSPRRAVVKDAAALADLWKSASAHRAPLPPPPPVDFTKEMFALASLGEQPSGGFSVEIVGVRRVDGKIRILVSERKPAAGEVTTAALTQPWHAVVLDRSDDPVEWVEYVPPGKR